MKKFFNTLYEMRYFLMLWFSQSFSALGSSMTAYALVIWSYNQKGSALTTAMLMVCSYAPYVIFSIFAGTLSDKWNKKKTMLVCDSISAMTTVIIMILLESGNLKIPHIYIINAINGLMNTVQQPASEVAVTRLTPEKFYQKIGGFRYLSNSINLIFTPIIATAVMGVFGMKTVILFDLFTFSAAFLILLLFIKIPEVDSFKNKSEKFIASVKSGLVWLKKQRGIFNLILFLAAINLVASMYNAAFPAMMLSREGGSEKAMGVVNTVIGISTLAGSIIASAAKPPKSRVKVICSCLLFSMSTENLLLALGRNVWVWSLGGFLGWIAIPIMNTNLDAIMRLNIPVEIQGRIYSVRNSLQFFTIPVGYFLGGLAVDYICEPIMSSQKSNVLTALFGSSKGSGAALFFFIIAFIGTGICLYFKNNKDIHSIEKKSLKHFNK